MKRFPSFDRTALTDTVKGRTVHHVRLRSVNECGARITGTAKDHNLWAAQALAFQKLAKADAAAVNACKRRGTHHH